MPGSEPLDWDGYCTRWSASHGGYDPRSASAPARAWLRLCHRLGTALARSGVQNPNAMTTAGLVISAGVPFTAATIPPGPLVAAILVLLSAVADTLDGVLALVTGRATRLGQVYDATADRLSEAAWLTAFALLGAPLWLATTAGAVMWLHEYVRARATLAGLPDIGTVTIAERPTRILLVIFGLLATQLDHRAATPTLAVALAVSLLGLGQLARAVHQTLR
ncbi:CDP-alcohol phosphatidyltransferase family protein [Dactylosporangium sp. CA-092794]|uniref:CDP-alcohol phosphatidyltransferase family protein n=1 Tax=Dactylosporangium sp. CA-092794 TaxID=3239929 RepID=UPI003D8D318C